MKLKLSEINSQFWEGYREVINLDSVICELSKNAPLDFVLTKLDEIKASLHKREHEINFLMIEKNREYKEIENRKVFDSVDFILAFYGVCYLALFKELRNPELKPVKNITTPTKRGLKITLPMEE